MILATPTSYTGKHHTQADTTHRLPGAKLTAQNALHNAVPCSNPSGLQEAKGFLSPNGKLQATQKRCLHTSNPAC